MTGEELQRQVEEYIRACPYQQGGRLLLAAAKSLLDKQTSYSPSGSSLLRLAKHDGTLTVSMATGEVAQMLSVAHDALKQAIGVGGDL